MMSPPVLVLGTGRCGSTLLSRMMRLHPDVLSVSELFSFVSDLGLRIDRAFPVGVIDGAHFWSMLAECQPRQSMLLRHGLIMPEVVYPWDRGRYEPETGLPPVLSSLVPHLEPNEPDRLFDEIGQAMMARPRASAADHYRALFAWLARRFDRRCWLERSGGSLRVAGRLIEAFPEAKVIHLVRDGRDTALSMSRHVGFRMALLCGLQKEMLGVDPYESEDRSEVDDLDDELVDLLPENFSAEAFRAADLPPEMCGHYWAGEIVKGLAELDRLDAARLLHLRYEDLVEDPAGTVARVGRFVADEVDPEWLDQVVDLVEVRPSARHLLSDVERRHLTAACRPGLDALSRRGLEWPLAP